MSTEGNQQGIDDASNAPIESTSEQTQQIDIDDDDEDDNSIEAIYTENKLIKSAMTESYSEILNSPDDEMLDINIDCEHGIQIEIPKRRSSSLNRNPSSLCEYDSGYTKFTFALIFVWFSRFYSIFSTRINTG